MTERPSASIASRKQPRQARSSELVAAILDAATQVLAKEGAQRFTTARVAEKAGVAAPLYRDAPEARALRASGAQTMRRFMREALPDAPDERRALAADLVTTTLSLVGKRFSERPRTASEIEAYGDAMADMICAYLVAMGRGGEPSPRITP